MKFKHLWTIRLLIDYLIDYALLIIPINRLWKSSDYTTLGNRKITERMDKYCLTLNVNNENTVAFRAFTLFSDVEIRWPKSYQIGSHFHKQMTFRQLAANSLGLYLIRKWTWVKRQNSSSRFIIALMMNFCSSFTQTLFLNPFKVWKWRRLRSFSNQI